MELNAGLGRVVLASGNAGKLREMQALLASTGIELIAQGALGVPDAPEPFGTFVENALAKARHASRMTGLPALADDSGICVRALGGAPGVHSARYASIESSAPRSDAANNARLVRELAGATDRSALFYCVLVLLRHADDPQPLIADGAWHGVFIDTPRGAGGFGYDPHFWLPKLGLTASELDAQSKNRLSHRAQAMHALLQKVGAAQSGVMPGPVASRSGG